MQTVIVLTVMRLKLPVAAFATVLTLAACGAEESTGTDATGDCPTAPVSVVVSVDQWGDIVSDLGGSCAKVTTVLAGSSLDPHDFEPAPSDAAKFVGAQLVVLNGGHYDEWATKLAQSSAPQAPVISAVPDDAHGGNPHAWYSPDAIDTVADAVTAALGELAPDAKDYFAQRHGAFTDTMKPYRQLVDTLKAKGSDKTYAATETVFDNMATAVGLTDRTPPGYAASASNETDPSPADLDAFLRLLGDHGVDVLIYNTQTEGSVPQQLRAAAEKAGVPVVDVTETVAPGAASFEAWQVDQLTALAKALGV